MVRILRRATIVALLLLLGACAAEEPELVELPLPPPAPPRLQARPVLAAHQRPRPAEPDGTATPAEAAVAAITPPVALPAAPAWRVVRDGTLGCADAAPLRLLRNGADAAPRVLAEARTAGGCRTTFRVNEWALERSDADLVRLRLVNGPGLALWFLRGDVVAP